MTTARASVPAARASGFPPPARGVASPARGVASPTPAPSLRERPVERRPRPERGSGRLGPVHTGQLVCWQGAIAAVAATLGRDIALTIAVSVLAVIVLAFTAIRIRGRWLYQWFSLAMDYSLRETTLEVPRLGDRRAELLSFVARGGAMANTEFDKTEIGVIEHAGGVTAVLELTGPQGGLIAERPVVLPSPAALLPPADPAVLPTSVQLIIQTVPAILDGNDPAAVSYQQLTEGLIPAERRAWLALQLIRTVDSHPDEVLRKMLGGSVRRMIRRLRQDGITARALDGNETLNTLASLAHLTVPSMVQTRNADGSATIDLRALQQAGPIAREDWKVWWTQSVPQATYRIRRWPDLSTPPGSQLFARLASVPASAVTVSLAARRPAWAYSPDAQKDKERGGADEVMLEAAIRIAAADTDRLAHISSLLVERASACGATLERLNGQHRYGLAATLPLGGFVP